MLLISFYLFFLFYVFVCFLDFLRREGGGFCRGRLFKFFFLERVSEYYLEKGLIFAVILHVGFSLFFFLIGQFYGFNRLAGYNLVFLLSMGGYVVVQSVLSIRIEGSLMYYREGRSWFRMAVICFGECCSKICRGFVMCLRVYGNIVLVNIVAKNCFQYSLSKEFFLIPLFSFVIFAFEYSIIVVQYIIYVYLVAM
uniref:hypothetical protein n=1 Tax=Polypodium hydriforme TaxID=43186 RepID=UPI002114A4CA